MKNKIILICIVLVFVFASVLYFLPPPQAITPEQPKIAITSLLIEPSRDDGGMKLYHEGSVIILGTRNSVRKEIWFLPKGATSADLSKILFQDLSTGEETSFPITEKNLLGEMWAKAYDARGELVETEHVNIAYDESFLAEEIQVESPKPDDVIKSPQKIFGKAKGSWFFEANMPVTLLDANKKVLTKIPLQAKGDWMTSDFVDFEGTLTFTKSETDTGTVIFENDNPSGLPENAKSFSVPVRFK